MKFARRSTVLPQLRWTLLLCSIAVVTVASLSIHIVMLDWLRVPHPDNSAVSRFALLLDKTISIIAITVFYRLAQQRLSSLSIVSQCLITSTIYAMLGEALRRFLMDVVVSHDLAYCLVENLPAPIEDIIVCSLIVLAVQLSTRKWQLIGSGFVVACAAIYLVNPVIDATFSRLLNTIEYLDTGNIYNAPYGWQVNVPSYLTFVEPVMATFAVAALVWNRLSKRPLLRLLQFVALVMAMKRSIVPTLLFSFYQNSRLPVAILSESQFALEVFVMAALTAIGWRICQPSLMPPIDAPV